MRSKLFTIIFLVIACLDLYQVYFDGSRYISKALIVISLTAYYLYNWSNLDSNKPRLLFLLGLMAAFGGDMLLEFEGYFVFGLASFLVMQLLYSYCFLQDRSLLRKKVWYGYFLAVTITLIMIFLWNHLGDLRIPVLVYSAAIALMSFSAFLRDHTIKAYSWVFLGTILFIISDTVIALHKFSDDLDLGKLTVMVTYIMAQYAIVLGYIEGIRIRKK